MEGPILAAVLSSTLPRLYKAIEGRSKKRQRCLESDVDSIKVELKYIKAAIGDHRKISRNDMSNLWRTRIEDLRHLAYDIEDCVDNFCAERDVEELPTKIRKLKESAEESCKQFQRYLSEESKKKQHSSLCAQDLVSHADQDNDPVFVGMEHPSSEIEALLRQSQKSSERKLRVIFIVGIGGIGKTFLANKLYRDVHNQFDLHAFVPAAGKDRKEVLEEILKQLHKKHVQQGEGSTSIEVSEDMNDVRTRLKSCLGNNRYLVVIDGIESEEFGSYVLDAFPPVNEVDSRIIVTTTVQSVEQSCSFGHRHVYKMRRLSNEKSKYLFLKVAFGTGEEELSFASKKWLPEILNKCDGVPLALVSLAKYCKEDLRRYKEACWKLCTFTPQPEEDHRLARMRRGLDYSFDTLSSVDLQACLLYFCMFPREHPIRRGSLIRQWLAEGPEVGCSTMLHAAKNFWTLTDRNVICPTEVSNNEKKVMTTWQPPGMMFDYIVHMSEKEKFIMLSRNNTSDREYIRRLSVHHTGAGSAADGEQALHNDLSRLRTLAVFNKGEGDPLRLDFTKYVLLRVLHLEACHGPDNNDQLKKICELLKLLKYLSLRTNITVVPRIICKLYWLETLDLGKKTQISVYPEVLELPNLKHLLGKLELEKYDSNENSLKKFMSGGRSALETLSGFVTGQVHGFPQLMHHMRRLRKVKIWCDSNASDKNLEALSQSIMNFLRQAECTPSIPHSLSVDFNGCTLPFLNSALPPGNLPEEHHHGGLSTLKLRGMLSPVPAFVTKLRGITQLCLSSAILRWDAIVAGVSSLIILEYLKLVSDSNIEGDVVIQCDQFISLKRMCLVAEQSVPQITISPDALEYLVSLHLLCPGLGGHSANQIRPLKSLKEVALHSRVDQETWKEAARDNPNMPSVVFIDRP